jgi:hypothetical protein
MNSDLPSAGSSIRIICLDKVFVFIIHLNHIGNSMENGMFLSSIGGPEMNVFEPNHRPVAD